MDELQTKYNKVVSDNIKLLIENIALLNIERELCDKLAVKTRIAKVAVFGGLAVVALCLMINDKKL